MVIVKNNSAKMHRIRLKKEKETLLLTLYAKAVDSQAQQPILNDKKAYQIMNSIDYDFKRLESFGKFVVTRAKHIDEWILEFIRKNPDALVFNLGCGLDTRVSRVDPPPGISWFDVDYPDVIALRRNFFSNDKNYRMISSSILQRKWLSGVPRNRPVLVVGEGVFEYLREEEMKMLLNRITDAFQHGQIVFDVMNSFAVKSARSSLKRTTGAKHTWIVDDLKDVDSMNPKLRRTASLPLFVSKNLPMGDRLLFGAMAVVPKFRNMIRLVRYDF